ncbi:uncharacterized mitochondrial protein AtMg00860-like [Arachis duranensis]|uniref:Uncharacterized mitochondrial protein AtMg00860-like n=1 Tax=Arachis duranensis TaxID=130453 RepID=A0A6P4C6H0_ARADU|nr:uncharacterized mitochondrial protein AtMg00860-like [Arachis duranensis]
MSLLPSFLHFSAFKLDAFSGTYSFEIDGRIVSFNLDEALKHPPEDHSIFHSVDPAKVDVISSLPYPSSVREVHSFLGHAGFYWRFIKDFIKVALPLSRLLQKDVEFELSADCVEAFDKLKITLTQAPIVRGPD